MLHSSSSKTTNDLRAEAEARVARQQQLRAREQQSIREAQRPASEKAINSSSGSSSGGGSIPGKAPQDASLDNSTPNFARLAEKDYKLNGGRARSNTGDFVAPRWVLDEEVTCCTTCRAEFDWVNRRHHCRHCGQIYCDACSSERSLLPAAFGQADPQRVCTPCHKLLAPMQGALTSVIANHQRVNAIDLTDKLLSLRYLNLPYSDTLGSEVRKAAYSVHNLFSLELIRDRNIPLQLLQQAHGLAFFTVLKGGYMLGARVGTGLVISKLDDGSWSAPSAVGMVGLSWGALCGADLCDYVMVLSRDAVATYVGHDYVTCSLSLGAGAELAVGPMGRTGTATVSVGDSLALALQPCLSYSHCRGLYAALSLDACLLFSRPEVNRNFYGRSVTTSQILRGHVPSPRAAQPLYDRLYDALSTPISGAAAYQVQYPHNSGDKQPPALTQALSPVAPKYVVDYDSLVTRPPPVQPWTGGFFE